MDESSEMIHLFQLPPEIFSHFGSFLPGKSISTFALVVTTCNERQEGDRAARQMAISARNRCTGFLDDAPKDLHECWRLLSDNLLRTENATLNMRQTSEWCAVLDYCEQCPRILSEYYKAKPERKCWILGGGNVTPQFEDMSEDESLYTSQAVLASHIWEPRLIYSVDQWFDPQVGFSCSFPSNWDVMHFQPSAAIGLMSWRDGNAFIAAHQQVDLDAGMTASHTVRDPETRRLESELLWLPRSTCRMYPVHQDMNSVGLEWLTEIARYIDNHMLCTWTIYEETHPSLSNAEFVQNGLFVEKVKKLLALMYDLW